MKNKFNIGDLVVSLEYNLFAGKSPILGEITSIRKEKNGIWYGMDDGLAGYLENEISSVEDFDKEVTKFEENLRERQSQQLANVKRDFEGERRKFEERKNEMIEKIKEITGEKK